MNHHSSMQPKPHLWGSGLGLGCGLDLRGGGRLRAAGGLLLRLLTQCEGALDWGEFAG